MLDSFQGKQTLFTGSLVGSQYYLRVPSKSKATIGHHEKALSTADCDVLRAHAVMQYQGLLHVP